MPRHVALLRGVSPMNARMPDLARAFEAAGFTDVRTVLSSGNVAFDAPAASAASLARRAEAAMTAHLGRSFPTIVRPSRALRELIAADPWTAFDLPAGAKRVVTFLREPCAVDVPLPIEGDGVQILAARGCEVLTVYVRGPSRPVFMTMIERAFGTGVTTRTWDTVRRCAVA